MNGISKEIQAQIEQTEIDEYKKKLKKKDLHYIMIIVTLFTVV